MADEHGAVYYDNGATYDSGLYYDGTLPAAAPAPLTSETITLNSQSTMEYWEVTKQRAQLTLAAWTQYIATVKVGGRANTDLETLIGEFEPLVQERTAAQDTYDAGYRAVQDALLRMKILGTKLPQILEAQLDENLGIMKDVDDLYAVAPRTEASILKRARMLYPVWVRANTALGALVPPQGPITRAVGGTVYTAALLKTLLDGYTALVQTMSDTQEAVDVKRAALRALDRTVDQLNKRWYKLVKASYDPGSDVYEALADIPTEPGTPAPEPVEIATVTQGGEGGLQVLVAYVPGGGEHATTKLVKWQVVGVDPGFDESLPLDASGNALGPFTQGQVVKIITEVSNSTGSRTTAPRTITIGPPIP
jgi:hypothetical protein